MIGAYLSRSVRTFTVEYSEGLFFGIISSFAPLLCCVWGKLDGHSLDLSLGFLKFDALIG